MRLPHDAAHVSEIKNPCSKTGSVRIAPQQDLPGLNVCLALLRHPFGPDGAPRTKGKTEPRAAGRSRRKNSLCCQRKNTFYFLCSKEPLQGACQRESQLLGGIQDEHCNIFQWSKARRRANRTRHKVALVKTKTTFFALEPFNFRAD